VATWGNSIFMSVTNSKHQLKCSVGTEDPAYQATGRCGLAPQTLGQGYTLRGRIDGRYLRGRLVGSAEFVQHAPIKSECGTWLAGEIGEHWGYQLC